MVVTLGTLLGNNDKKKKILNNLKEFKVFESLKEFF